jgi:methylglutamate dehydrogenase subunit A
MSLPSSARYVVIGAGMHGLSTALHLARDLRASAAGSGADVVVLEKSTPGAGATGIACGVVRNNYFQPAMSELMQACVEVWESDPVAYHYNSVGYVALGPQVQDADLTSVFERHQRIGYRSELILGEADVAAHMKGLFPDWRAQGVTVCLHEHQGGFAFNLESVAGLRDKCVAEGVSIVTQTEVTGFEFAADESVTGVVTDRGTVTVGEQVVIAPGPWAQRFWRMLGLPDTIDIRQPSGEVAHDVRMWTYWNLQEGEITVDPLMFALADGGAPPVIHLDTDAPLYTDGGELVTDELWGIYYKRDRHGVQGGASPLTVDGEIELDPYPATTNVDPSFADMWCAALSHAMGRFEGCRAQYKNARSGGVGSFTADNFPVFDYLKPNVYGVLDSNHGYKMIGVGREVAKVLLGEHSSLLHPFRFERFAAGDLHPVSNSPYPWS